MNERKRCRPLTITLFVVLSLTSVASFAHEILDATGVKGGLVVHVGCGDGKLLATLGGKDGYLVHGLDADPKNVEVARAHIKALDRYGKVTVGRLRGTQLPYVDNLVNLVVAEDLGGVAMDEVMRVLAPNGVAYVKSGGEWTTTVKPRPENIDEWTHFLHGPDNNAVASDSVVGLPRHLKWLGRPKFARAHEQAASLSACVTTGGRLFYIIDETPRADIRFPAQWFLVARDAFNGVVLWKRAIPTWIDQLRRFRSGPAETAFRLAAQDDRVYVTLGIDAPVSILSAATGETIATCDGTENARQILRIDDKLVVLVDTRPQANESEDSQIRRGGKPAPGERAIVVTDPSTGKTLWRKKSEAFVHPTLAAKGDRLFYQTSADVHCLDLADGDQVWSTPAVMQLAGHEAGWESPTLVAGDGMVYCADFKKIYALSEKDGTVLWEGPSSAGYNFPPDVFLIDGLVWTKARGITGADPTTGEVKRKLPSIPGYMHARCYRNKATERFLVLGNQGVQFVDLESADASINHWIRGTCQYGILPANGLLYVTPDSCACNMKTKLAGLWVLAAEGQSTKYEAREANGEVKSAQGTGQSGVGTERLAKGPAYGDVRSSTFDLSSSKDWPVYRHDFGRTGRTQAVVPADVKLAWQADLGGRLSGITAAAGRVFVSSIDKNTVYALDEQSGETIWTYTAEGRVDSPPTIYQGVAIFGSADGHVYALRASDGALVWRFRAAPEDRRTFVNGQLESVWPVHGSIVVYQGALVVTAGRSSYLDGGVRVCRIDPTSGALLGQTTIYSPDPETGKQPAGGGKDVRGVKSDILLVDGESIYMRHMKLDLETGDETGTGVHLFSPVGLLDDTWWHRAYWVMNDSFTSHWSGWWQVGNRVPSGRILVYDDESVFGYGRDQYPGGNTGQWRGGEKYRLFACDRKPPSPSAPKAAPKPAANNSAEKRRRPKKPTPPAANDRWSVEIPFYVRAMAVAGDTMFIAGPIQADDTKSGSLVLADGTAARDAWEGKLGSLLWAVSTTDGKKLAAQELDSPPVWDGMAAIEGRLLLATRNGKVHCFGN
jgi:outer membrane protein assembly factor BamB